jgi:hypothetical protein
MDVRKKLDRLFEICIMIIKQRRGFVVTKTGTDKMASPAPAVVIPAAVNPRQADTD